MSISMFDSAAIRRLFLEPEPSYSVSEAAAFLGMSRRELLGWVEAGLHGIEVEDAVALDHDLAVERRPGG